MKQLSSKEAFQLAMKYHQKGELDKAEQLYSSVLQVDMHNSDAKHYLGLIFASKGDIDPAIEYIRQAIELDRTNATFHNNIGELYRQQGQFEHAEFHLTSAVELKPDYVDAYTNLGLLYKELGRIDDAKFCFAEALQKDPRNVNALLHTGKLFVSLNESEDAIQCFEAALDFAPENPAVLASTAATYYNMGEYNTSAKYYSKLTSAHPHLHNDKVNLALITLRNKDFRKGFQLYESRFKALGTMEGNEDNLWRGTSLSGKTLYIYNEKQGLSGFGDTLLFSRYVLELEKFEPQQIIFRVQPELVELLKANMPEFVHVTADSCIGYDAHSPLLSLPLVLNARAKTIPHSEGYIKPDKDKTEQFAEIMKSDKKKVGIAFQTSRSHIEHEKRSVDQNALAPLYNNSDLSLFYVSKEEPDEDLDASITDLSSKIDTFADTAAILANLDILITADTSLVHLAGAMGIKTVLLINHLHDWRWFNAKTGKVSEWYDSVTFHIKDKDSTWQDVVSSIDI